MPFLPPNQQRQSTEGSSWQLSIKFQVSRQVVSLFTDAFHFHHAFDVFFLHFSFNLNLCLCATPQGKKPEWGRDQLKHKEDDEKKGEEHEESEESEDEDDEEEEE